MASFFLDHPVVLAVVRAVPQNSNDDRKGNNTGSISSSNLVTESMLLKFINS